MKWPSLFRTGGADVPMPAGLARAIAAAGCCAAVALPFAVPDYMLFRFTLAAIWAIAIVGMVILAGVNGQFSFGHSAFYGIGGYTAAAVATHFGQPIYWALPLSVLLCFAVGYAFGLLAARLDLWHLALATYALAVAFPQLLRWRPLAPITGGVQGYSLDLQGAPAWTGLSGDRWWYALSVALLGAGMVLARNLIASRTGRALRAVRDNDIAAAAHGIDVTAHRALAFAVSAAYVGLAGCLAAIQLNFTAPGSYTFWLSVEFLIGLVIGGINSIGGAAIGGLFLQFFPDLTAQLGRDLSMPLYGALLILAVLAMPTGLAGAIARLATLFSRRTE